MVDSRPSTQGYFSIAITLEGSEVHFLDKEAGGHRLQRTPPTERKGRVHTSTVTVSVTDPNNTSILEVPDSDLKIDWYSGSGAGGQFRNKHKNSCRLTHIPTGMICTAQTRSRENSFREAKAAMLQKLQQIHKQEQYNVKSTIKRQQVGSGMRGDKIRTIRFQDDQAIDHRTHKRIRAEEYMNGYMNLLW